MQSLSVIGFTRRTVAKVVGELASKAIESSTDVAATVPPVALVSCLWKLLS